jgi:F-type H+-transporting ATPase subunit a
MAAPNISLISDEIVNIGGFGITNSALAFMLISVFILAFALLVRGRLSLIPGRLQVVAEGLVSYIDDLLQQQLVNKKVAKWFLPFMVALFLYIFFANQFSIFPLLQSLVVSDEPMTYLFRAPTTDLGFPFIMAFIVILFTQLIAFATHPLRHIGNYIKIVPLLKARSLMDLFTAGIELFLGLLDIVGEVAKVVSLSCRLFGNVLAGELMIIIISSLFWWTSYFIPIPFFALSLLSGVIQTLVFVLLSIGFMSTTLNGLEPETA